MNAESGETTFKLEGRTITSTSKLSLDAPEDRSTVGITQVKEKPCNQQSKAFKKLRKPFRLRKKKELAINDEEDVIEEQEPETQTPNWDPPYEISDEGESMHLQERHP